MLNSVIWKEVKYTWIVVIRIKHREVREIAVNWKLIGNKSQWRLKFSVHFCVKRVKVESRSVSSTVTGRLTGEIQHLLGRLLDFYAPQLWLFPCHHLPVYLLSLPPFLNQCNSSPLFLSPCEALSSLSQAFSLPRPLRPLDCLSSLFLSVRLSLSNKPLFFFISSHTCSILMSLFLAVLFSFFSVRRRGSKILSVSNEMAHCRQKTAEYKLTLHQISRINSSSICLE